MECTQLSTIIYLKLQLSHFINCKLRINNIFVSVWWCDKTGGKWSNLWQSFRKGNVYFFLRNISIKYQKYVGFTSSFYCTQDSVQPSGTTLCNIISCRVSRRLKIKFLSLCARMLIVTLLIDYFTAERKYWKRKRIIKKCKQYRFETFKLRQFQYWYHYIDG